MSEVKQSGSASKKTPTKSESNNKKTTPIKSPQKSDSKTKSNVKESKETKDNLNHLPLARIRTIMKSAPDADMISQEALILVCRAAEMFIQQMTKEGHKKSQKQNFLEYKDLAAVVAGDEKLEFLASIIPKKITVREYKKRLAEESSSDDNSYEDSEEDESEEESSEEEESGSGEEESGEGSEEEKEKKINGGDTIELSSDEEAAEK